MSLLLTYIKSFLWGEIVGTDSFGNTYYIAPKKKDSFGRPKRWVLMKGRQEASKIPPEWHGWLHYTVDDPQEKAYGWEKAHLPNLTGTPYAWLPPRLRDGENQEPQKTYEPWNP